MIAPAWHHAQTGGFARFAPFARVTARRRSFILVAVLVITVSALLVATNLLFIIDASLTGSAHGRDRTQARMLAWSGVQAVASRLDEQRERILEGALPDLDDEYVIYESGGVAGVVRLLPVTGDGALLAPQAGRLDLNRVDADALVATGLVEESIAQAIIAHRDGPLGGTFQSVAALLDVPGVDFEMVYGPPEDIEVADQAAGSERDLGQRVTDRLEGAALEGIADVVTVYGVEPAIQRSGVKRINLNTPWSEELGERVDRRFGPGSGAALRQIMTGGTSFDSEARIFQVLRFFNVDAQEWPDLADALTAEKGDYHFGRLDINRAPVETLVALPGIDEELAAQIVRARDGLSAEDRATIVWPLLQEIVPAEAYDQLAGRITTRSWTYRVRLAAWERPSGAGSVDYDVVPAVPMIVEAVIDLCDPRARIAYLREISYLQTAAILASHASFDGDDSESADDEGDVAAQPDAEERRSDDRALDSFSGATGLGASDDDLEDAPGGSRDQGRSLDENRQTEDVYDDETVDQEVSRPAGPLSDRAGGGVPSQPAPPVSGAPSSPGADEPTGSESGAGPPEVERPQRIGRWRTGR